MDPTQLPDVAQIIQPQHLELYRQQVRDIWRRLIRMHTNLEDMRRVETYGLNEVLGPDALGFWQSFLDNYGDSVVMLLATLVVDSSNDTLNLPGFANRVLRWLKPEYQEAYRQKLRDARFADEHRAVKEKIDQVRDHHVAHVVWNSDATEGRPVRPSVKFSEITVLVNRLRELFDVVSLTHQLVIELPGYDKRLDASDQRAYIDDLLDQTARASSFVTTPERLGDRWPQRRASMPPARLEQLRRWRTKLGMAVPDPEISG